MSHGYIAQSGDPLPSLAEEYKSSSASACHTAQGYGHQTVCSWIYYSVAWLLRENGSTEVELNVRKEMVLQIL